MITEDQFLGGLGSLLEIAEDLLVDIPQFWDFIAQIISPVLTKQAANIDILKPSSSCLMSGELGKRCAAGRITHSDNNHKYISDLIIFPGKYVSAVLHEMAKSGQAQAAALWSSSGLRWSDFLQETALDQFLRDNSLEWTIKVGIIHQYILSEYELNEYLFVRPQVGVHLLVIHLEET